SGVPIPLGDTLIGGPNGTTGQALPLRPGITPSASGLLTANQRVGTNENAPRLGSGSIPLTPFDAPTVAPEAMSSTTARPRPSGSPDPATVDRLAEAIVSLGATRENIPSEGPKPAGNTAVTVAMAEPTETEVPATQQLAGLAEPAGL